MATVQNVLDRARKPLNDADKVRYPDSELLDYLNDALALAYAVRPDLRFGQFGTTPARVAATDSFPLGPQYEVAVQHYVVFRAEGKDDENVNTNREEKARAYFEKILMT